MSFSLEMLDHAKQLFGENAPERLLFRHFQKQEEIWRARLSKGTTLLYKARLLAKIREKEGLFVRCIHDAETGTITLREYHHPLKPVFEVYPRAVALEQRALEVALGARISRETSAGQAGLPGHTDLVLQ